MKKNKLLICGIATMLAFGIRTNAMAVESNAVLYKNAYDATEAALNIKKQKEINNAREAINLMPNKLYSAKCEFSKQVDSVQQPILQEIVQAIESAKETEAQQDINRARATIPDELPSTWKSSYSSAIDEIQNKVITKVEDSISNAKKTRNRKDINLANELIESVKNTDNDETIQKWIEGKYEEFMTTFKNQLSHKDDKPSKEVTVTSYDLECEHGKTKVIDDRNDIDGADVVNICGEGNGTIDMKGIAVDEINIDTSEGGVKLSDISANKVHIKNLGKNSLYILNSNIENIIIDDSHNKINLTVSGSKSEIGSIDINTGCTINAQDNIKKLTLNNGYGTSRVQINGNLKNANVLLENSVGIELYASVNTLEILDNGSEPYVAMYNSCKIEEMYFNTNQPIKLYFQDKNVLNKNIKAINGKTGKDKLREVTDNLTTNLK